MGLLKADKWELDVLSQFMKDHRDLINKHDYEELYRQAISVNDFVNVPKRYIAELLLDSGIKPLHYMQFVPSGYLYGSKIEGKIILPKQIRTVGLESFGTCPKIESVYIGDNVETIARYAFDECVGLKKVFINSNNLNEICEMSFAYCTMLEDIYFKGTMQQWEDIKKADDWDYYTVNYTIHCTDGDLIKRGK